MNNCHFSADFGQHTKDLVLIFVDWLQNWESVKQAQKEQSALVDGVALLFLPSLNNEGNMTTNGTLQSAKDDLSMQAQLDKRQQLLQSDTLMERDDFCCLLFVDVLVSCANRFQRTCCWQTEWHLTL